MKANIKYNYIPKGKITISTLTQMFELTEEEIYNIGIIDNASKGVRLYSNEISKYAYLCKPSDLVSQINSLIKKLENKYKGLNGGLNINSPDVYKSILEDKEI